jgi:hypothetical protein
VQAGVWGVAAGLRDAGRVGLGFAQHHAVYETSKGMGNGVGRKQAARVAGEGTRAVYSSARS